MRDNEKRKLKIIKRNENIVADFGKLKAIQDNGIQRYSYEWMLNKLATQYYLSEFTIEAIIKQK